MTGSLLLALAAGVLSTLSPCVLPLLPVILGAAVGESRYGPVALSAGVATSFVAVGLFIALAGQAIGLDQSVMRSFAGLALVVLGLTLALPMASEKFATATAPIGAWVDQRFGGFQTAGISGQFMLGLLLGAVWSPCVGPTLGAASLLAAQGENLAAVAATMALFSIGAALPLLGLGLLSRAAMARWRTRLQGAGKGGKAGLGILLAVIGVLVLTGLDKRLEAAAVASAPEWWIELTTRF